MPRAPSFNDDRYMKRRLLGSSLGSAIALPADSSVYGVCGKARIDVHYDARRDGPLRCLSKISDQSSSSGFIGDLLIEVAHRYAIRKRQAAGLCGQPSVLVRIARHGAGRRRLDGPLPHSPRGRHRGTPFEPHLARFVEATSAFRVPRVFGRLANDLSPAILFYFLDKIDTGT